MIAYTGAGGWIGRRLAERLASAEIPALAIRARGDESFTLPAAETMIHLGAIAHDLAGARGSDEYRRANTRLPLELARRCEQAGYREFVFVSSAKVIGERTDAPVAETAVCHAQGAYAESKRAAEQALSEFARDARMRIIMIRAPLVYGPGVGANFRRLLEFADSPLPWPVSTRPVRRSMIYIDNLVDILLRSPALAPAASGDAICFHVADGPAPTLESLVAMLRREFGRPARRVPIPAALLDWAMRRPRLAASATRLFANFELDISRILRTGWLPPVSLEQGVSRTVIDYRSSS